MTEGRSRTTSNRYAVIVGDAGENTRQTRTTSIVMYKETNKIKTDRRKLSTYCLISHGYHTKALPRFLNWHCRFDLPIRTSRFVSMIFIDLYLIFLIASLPEAKHLVTCDVYTPFRIN